MCCGDGWGFVDWDSSPTFVYWNPKLAISSTDDESKLSDINLKVFGVNGSFLQQYIVISSPKGSLKLHLARVKQYFWKLILEWLLVWNGWVVGGGSTPQLLVFCIEMFTEQFY